MEWLDVEYEAVPMKAANFLDGVLVKIPDDATPFRVYAAGWKVIRRRGDMSGNAFRRLPLNPPSYLFKLEPAE